MTDLPFGGVFVSWVAYHGRSADVAEALNLEPLWISKGTGRRWLEYIRQIHRTWIELVRRRPVAVAVMQPPVVALVVCLTYCLMSRRRLLADLHSGFFYGEKWSWAQRPALSLLRVTHSIAVVTNGHLRDRCARAGVHTVILHDLVRDTEDVPVSGGASGGFDYVFVPLSYASDEPIGEILQAAALSDMPFILSGSAPIVLKDVSRPNVIFSGFVDGAEFGRLMREAAVVVALTTKDHTMQRAAYEALQNGKALVTSAFGDLRDYFGEAAMYCRPAANELAIAVRAAQVNRVNLEDSMRRLRAERLHAQVAALESIRSHLVGRT